MEEYSINIERCQVGADGTVRLTLFPRGGDRNDIRGEALVRLQELETLINNLRAAREEAGLPNL